MEAEGTVDPVPAGLVEGEFKVDICPRQSCTSWADAHKAELWHTVVPNRLWHPVQEEVCTLPGYITEP